MSPDLTSRIAHCRDLIMGEHYEEAHSELSSLARIDPNRADIYELDGLSYLKQGNCAAAEKYLRRASTLEPYNSNILNNLGNALYRQNKLDESIEVYNRALQLPNAEQFKVLVNLGNSFADKGKVDDAIEQFNRALQMSPDFAPAYLGLGRMYCDHGKFDLAERELRNAVKYKPDYAMAYYYLGRAQNEQGKYKDALTSLKSSLSYEQNPRYRSDTENYIREVSARIKDSSRATPVGSLLSTQSADVPSFTTVTPPVATETKADALDAVKQLLMQRDWPAAQGQLEQIITQYGKDDAVVWNNLGYARMHQGSAKDTKPYLEAIEDYKTAIRLKGGPFPTAQYNLGHAYRLLNVHKYSPQAESAYRQAIKDARALGTTCPLAENGLGLVLKQKGDLKNAAAAFKTAIMQSGKELPVAHYNLALLLEQSGNSRKAVNEYRTYLNLEPHGFNAQKARHRLKRLGF
ncbi:MAG TPA: tetratricopeptide repeat protein, partial [Chroococcales cyanobacterium]